jgi:hypothetical protein
VSWFRRGPQLPPLPEPPKIADLPAARLESAGRYLGTSSSGEKVTAQGLGGQGSARIRLSDEALDVVRLGAPLRIPVTALRGARHEGDAVVVSWQHGDKVLETALRLSADASAAGTAEDKQSAWVRKISKLARKQEDAA